MKIKTEPALVTSIIVGLMGVIVPGVFVSDHVQAAITAGFALLFALVGGLHIRGKVTPVAVLNAAKEEAITEGKEAIVWARLHPDDVVEIANQLRAPGGLAQVTDEAITALTTGPHPMTFMPGADSSEPLPQPQGTYDAATAPNPLAPVAAGSTPASAAEPETH